MALGPSLLGIKDVGWSENFEKGAGSCRGVGWYAAEEEPRGDDDYVLSMRRGDNLWEGNEEIGKEQSSFSRRKVHESMAKIPEPHCAALNGSGTSVLERTFPINSS